MAEKEKDAYAELVNTVVDAIQSLANVRTQITSLEKALEQEHPKTFAVYRAEIDRLESDSSFQTNLEAVEYLRQRLLKRRPN
jgi:hypothetical protein